MSSNKTGFRQGRLGIGKEPIFPLDISGSMRIEGDLVLAGTIADIQGNPIEFGASSATFNMDKTFPDPTIEITEFPDWSNNVVVEGAGKFEDVASKNGDIYYNGGNVGIGTDSPGDNKLKVDGNLDVTGSISPLVGMVCFFAKTTAPTGWLSCSGQFISKTSYSNLYSVIGDTYGSNSTQFKLPDLRGNFIRCLNTTSSGTDTNRTLSQFQDFSTGPPQQTAFTAESGGSHTHAATTSSAGGHNHTASTASAGNHNHSASSGNSGAHRHSQGYWYNYAGSAYGGWHDPRMWAGAFSVGSWGASVYTTGNANEGGKVVGHHSHSVSVSNGGSHSHSVTVDSAGSHSHDVNIGQVTGHNHNIGGGDSETRPKNYALLACIKY